MKKVMAYILVMIILVSVVPKVNAEAVTQIEFGNTVSDCAAIKEDGSLWVWGPNKSQSGDSIIEQYNSLPEKLMDDVVSVNGTMAIKTDGSLWGWGENSLGQLGDGTTKDREQPVKIMDDVKSVYPTLNYTLAIKTDNSLWLWGYKNIPVYGVEPQGVSDLYQTEPVKVMDGVIAVESVNYSVLALKNDGTLWGWGANNYGQLGLDTSVQTQILPTKILDNVISFSLGGMQAVALKADATMWVWGQKDISEDVFYKPFKALDSVSYVEAHGGGIMALRNDGSLWGYVNEYGTLWGVNDISLNPIKVMDNVLIVQDGLAIQNDGSLWVIASGGVWTLTENQRNDYYDKYAMNLREIPPDKQLDSVVACYNPHKGNFGYALALRNDGSLWSWGSITSGGLGRITGEQNPAKMLDNVALPGQKGKSSLVPATPTSATVLVNGELVAFQAYNIYGNNYFKLRDIGMVLSGTAKQFEIGWDGENRIITMTTGMSYTTVGGELFVSGNKESKIGISTTASVYLDGEQIFLTAYNIDGNNYFKLRDLGASVDFGITWDGETRTIGIDTSTGYIE